MLPPPIFYKTDLQVIRRPSRPGDNKLLFQEALKKKKRGLPLIFELYFFIQSYLIPAPGAIFLYANCHFVVVLGDYAIGGVSRRICYFDVALVGERPC